MSVTNDLGQWYKSIPPITRVWFTGSIMVPVAARLGLVRPQNLVLFVKPIFKNLQVYSLILNLKFQNYFPQ
jgi:derlin-1